VILGRVLIVEDERFTRTMLATTLAALGFEVIGAASTAQAALAAMEASAADVALLDLDLGPGPSGIDVAYALRAKDAGIGLVFLTSFSDPRVKDPGERPLPVGSRFLVKSQLDDVGVLRSSLLEARHRPKQGAGAPRSASSLTAHQLAVLRDVAAGRTNADIAAGLGVSEKAVERTVQRIAESLSLNRSAGNLRVLLTRAYGLLAGKALPGS
jgi:DNA-binding NarL/FixJ family response regulator